MLRELVEELNTVGPYYWMPTLLKNGFFHEKLPMYVTMLTSLQNPEWHQEAPQDRVLTHPGNNNVFNHTWLTTYYASVIAHRNDLSQTDAELLHLAALFHDVAKPSTHAIGCTGLFTDTKNGQTKQSRCRKTTVSYGQLEAERLLARIFGREDQLSDDFYSLIENQARVHAEKYNHPFQPTYIRNLGHDTMGAEMVKNICRFAGEPPTDEVLLLSKLVANHINIGSLVKNGAKAQTYRDMNQRVNGRWDLLLMLYYADKAAAVYTRFANPTEALYNPDVRQKIEALRVGFEKALQLDVVLSNVPLK